MVRSCRKRESLEVGHCYHGKKKNRSSALEGNIVCKLLVQYGFIFNASDDQPNHLSVDQAILQKQLNSTSQLIQVADVSAELEELWKDNYSFEPEPSLEEQSKLEACSSESSDVDKEGSWFRNNHIFCISLLPTISTENCAMSSRGKQQDSLVRILLGVKALQTAAAIYLLEKLPGIQSDKDLSTVAMKLGDLDLTHLIVSHFRWLDVIVDNETLMKKIFEVISVSEVSTQQELISCIPDLIEDSNHAAVAEQLRQLLLENSHLVTYILDALSNMNLKGDLLREIKESVLQVLSSADVSDLPIVIKFYQQSVTDHNAVNATEVVQELRERLELTLSSASMQCASQTLIFDAIKSGIRFQKVLAESWVKVLQSSAFLQDQKVLDIFVLLVLHNTKSRRKSIESLIRNKIKLGHFTEEMLTIIFHNFSEVFVEYLNDIIVLGEAFLRSPEISISSYGCNLYKTVFRSFPQFAQQEVIGALVTHIGSGYEPEVDSAFSVLSSIVEEETAKMIPFNVFLKGILDYVDNLSFAQLRTLLRMVSKLSFFDNSDTKINNDDVYVLIRKQLSGTDSRSKLIGVIGAMTIVANIAEKRRTASPEHCLAQFEQVIHLLEMIKTNVKSDVKSCSLFYDELANVILTRNMDDKVMNWISDGVVSDFQDAFLIDAGTLKIRSDSRVKLLYDLNESEESGIAINIVPLMLSEQESQGTSSCSSSKLKLVPLASHFRLVCICEQKQNNGNVEGIDALLGCPLILFDESSNWKEDEKHTYCTSIIYAINWMREVLNAFSSENVDADVRGKILIRIKTLVTLHSALEKALLMTPTFELPVVDFGIDSNILSQIKTLKEIMDRKNPKNSKSKKEKGETIDHIDDLEVKGCDENTMAECFTVSLQNFPASFRQLDLQSFFALSYDSVNKATMDSEMHTKNREEVKLEAKELNFLLADLHRKVEHSFSCAARRSFLKQSPSKMIGFSNLPQDVEVLKFVTKILPSLCDLIKECEDYFQKVGNGNNSIVDCVERITSAGRDFFLLYSQLLQIIVVALKWDGFHQEDNKILLHEFLSVMLKNLTSVCEALPQAQLVWKLFCCFNCMYEILPISVATNCVKLLSTLTVWSDEKESLLENIKKLLEKYLKHVWIGVNGEKDKGMEFNEHYAYLIRTYISISKQPLKVIDQFCKGPVTELLTNKTGAGTSDYPCLTRSSFCSFYKSFFDELVKFTKNEAHFRIKITDTDEITLQRLHLVQTSIQVFHTLNSFVKAMDTRQILLASLKYSRLFLEQFLKCAMPLLDRTLRTNKDMVHSILKSAQQSTRSLQHLCGHSKLAKDVSMTTHVPALKKCLETFVFRVKAILAFNNCDSAFWLGNLKNRDLHGNEILSQIETTASIQESTLQIYSSAWKLLILGTDEILV